SGLIKGDSDSAIIFSSALASGFSHTITNQAGGIIQTGSSTAPAILTAADDVTINTSGTIDGSSSGEAITMGSGNNALNILGGSAAIIGDVTGGSGSNSLVVDPGVGNTFSYSGRITNFSSAQVESGTFNLSGMLSAGQTTVTGGALAGSGTLNGLVAVDAGGLISPGNGVGKITLQSGLSLSAGGEYLWQLGTLTDDSNGIAGVDFDQIALTGGNLTLGGSSELTLDFSALGTSDPNSADPFWQSEHSWTIIDGSGASNTGDTNFFEIADPSFADGSFMTSTDANGNAVLTYQVVPEPTSLTAVLASLGLLGLVRRRKRVG
ncbi:MAG TPA: PEP-CTERM sorting domain-containing protein, partial [Urbifossiella sp.]